MIDARPDDVRHQSPEGSICVAHLREDGEWSIVGSDEHGPADAECSPGKLVRPVSMDDLAYGLIQQGLERETLVAE